MAQLTEMDAGSGLRFLSVHIILCTSIKRNPVSKTCLGRLFVPVNYCLPALIIITRYIKKYFCITNYSFLRYKFVKELSKGFYCLISYLKIKKVSNKPKLLCCMWLIYSMNSFYLCD